MSGRTGKHNWVKNLWSKFDSTHWQAKTGLCTSDWVVSDWTGPRIENHSLNPIQSTSRPIKVGFFYRQVGWFGGVGWFMNMSIASILKRVLLYICSREPVQSTGVLFCFFSGCVLVMGFVTVAYGFEWYCYAICYC
jgi:hypothetical protein